MVVLHCRGAHGHAVPDFWKGGSISVGVVDGSVVREHGRGDPRARAKSIRETVVPGVEFGFETVPAFEEDMLGNAEGAGVDRVLVEVHIVAGANEVDDLGEDPDECVGDEVFFHYVVAFGVAGGACVGGAYKAHVIELEAGFCPEDEVLSI